MTINQNDIIIGAQFNNGYGSRVEVTALGENALLYVHPDSELRLESITDIKMAAAAWTPLPVPIPDTFHLRKSDGTITTIAMTEQSCRTAVADRYGYWRGAEIIRYKGEVIS